MLWWQAGLVTGVALVCVAIAGSAWAGRGGSQPAGVVAAGAVVGFSFLAVGLYATRRRPDSWYGLLMVGFGAAWFLAGLVGSPTSWAYTLGLAATGLFYAVLAHLLLAFPGARLEFLERTVLAAAYVDAVAGQMTAMLFLDPAAVENCTCPSNRLLLLRDDRLAASLLTARQVVGAALILVVAVLVLRRWQVSSTITRRRLAPVFGAGGLVLALTRIRE